MTCSYITLRMGQGSYLWIVNATAKILKLRRQNSYQMNSWNFNDIAAHSQGSFYVEFEESIFHTSTDDGGEADFQLMDTDVHFQLQVRFFKNSPHRNLQVDWSRTDTRKYTVFPPPGISSFIASIGWILQGSVCMIIQDKKSLSLSPDFPTGMHGNEWMRYYADVIGDMTLRELILPGTHDSATYKPVSFLGSPWIETQNQSLRIQLDQGVRVLDLRIGQNRPGDYIIVHDKWRTSYSLSEALNEIKSFVQDHGAQDIVILDFHRFVNLGKGEYDFSQLKDQVKTLLQGFILPVTDKTLGEIWKDEENVQHRIVVAWNNNSIDSSYMWPRVEQSWYREARNKKELRKAIESDFSTVHPSSMLWSAGVFTTSITPILDAKNLVPDIDNWLYGCADLTLKANIISTNFCPKHNNLIHASIIASLLKAGRKI